MTGPLETQVISPTLVGRAEQLQALHRQLEQARGGQGGVVLLMGEAGIGKTRLVGEIKALAQQMSSGVLQGNCFERERDLPYAPLIDLLQLYFAKYTPDQIVREFQPLSSGLASLLPQLAAYLPPRPQQDPEQTRHQLIHVLEQFFFQLAARNPLLLVVEDIHWSDDSSLDFLLHLAHRVQTWPLLLLLTYRSEEESTPLARFLAGLNRARLAYDIPLAPLTLPEVDALLRAIFKLQRPVSAEFLNAIHALTEGNPFFIEEVLKSLLASGDIFFSRNGWDRKPIDRLRIPRSVQVAVQQRAERLRPEARRVLTLAGLAGKRFDFVLLQALTRLDEQSLLAHLKVLVRAQLIVEESADQFVFRHALTRAAIYTSLLARERKHYHRLIAETLEDLFAGRLETHIPDLAYHFYQAGAWEQALAYSQRAGEQAQNLYAPREASEWFTRALQAAHHLALPAPIRLHRARGQAHETLGEFERARDDYERALQLARQSQDMRTEGQIAIELGFLWTSKDYMQAGRYFQQARQLAGVLGDAAMLAHSLNRLGNWHMNIEQPGLAEECHAEALAIFERLGDEPGLAETLDLLGITSVMMGKTPAGHDYYERAVALFRQLDDRRGQASSLAMMSGASANLFFDVSAVSMITLSQGVQYGALALDLCRQIGWRSGEALALIVCSGSAAGLGNYTQAWEQASKALEIIEEIGHRQWRAFVLAVIGWIHADLLAFSSARAYLERALRLAREINSPYWIRRVSGFLASVYVQQRELSLAAATLAAAPDPEAPPETLAQRTCWAARMELALALDDPALAVQIGAQMMTIVFGEAPPAPPPWQSAPRLLLLYGQALAAAQRHAEAEATLKAALAAAQAQQARPLVWRAHLALGRLFRGQRRYEAAAAEFAAGRGLIEELAAAAPDGELRRDFLHAALATLPPVRRSTSLRRATKQAFGGLTERERQVAALVGEGRSNHEIAAALVLSERTVERHISNILNKLGFQSRAQIIAWAFEKGLINAAGA